MYNYTNTQIHKYTNTQIHNYTNTQIHKYTNTHIHKCKYTNTQIKILKESDKVVDKHVDSRSNPNCCILTFFGDKTGFL